MKQEPKAGAAGDVEYITGPAIERRQDWTSSSVSSPADAGGLTPDPKLQVSGNVCEIGQLQDESEAHGIVIQRDSGEFVTIKGLAIEEVKALGPCFMDDITISFGGASPAPSAKQEPSVPDQALALVNLLQRWASWIVRERPKNLLDHACARCVPHSDMLVDGFSCVYHEALDTIGGLIPLAAPSASASPAAPKTPLDRLPWYCPQCQAGVPSHHVTFEEYHDPRAGGCGYRVGEWPAAPVAGSQQVPEGWHETLQAVRNYIDATSSQTGYGYSRPANPNDFFPDAECCTPEEIEAHRAACEAFDKGEYTPDPRIESTGRAHILLAPWGIGSYTYRDGHADELIAAIDALAAAAPAVPVPVEQDAAAWMTEDGQRVVTEGTMAGARKDGGAMLSSLRPYTVKLVRAAPSLQQGKEGSQP